MSKQIISVFPETTMKFLKRLEKNNNREWFNGHKEEYEAEFLIPSQQYVIELGEMLRKHLPGLHAVPKVDKSIFRLTRDVRFAKNKEPYKTNLGIFLWDGDTPRMEAPGFYTHVESGHCFLAFGVYMFTKECMARYRETVIDPAAGKELNAALKKITKNGEYMLGGQKYKRVPKGYDPEHPLAALLLHDGIHVYTKNFSPAETAGEDFALFSYKHFKAMLPLHTWMMKYLFS